MGSVSDLVPKAPAWERLSTKLCFAACQHAVVCSHALSTLLPISYDLDQSELPRTVPRA